MIRKSIIGMLVAFAFAFAGAATVYAEDCGHDFWAPLDDNSCECLLCGATKPHNFQEIDVENDNCGCLKKTTLQCSDCYHVVYQYTQMPPHKWGKPGWEYLADDEAWYGKSCVYCGEMKKVPITVKKGKTKRIVPKSEMKGVSKKKVKYNKKKVKATKDGKVKGKKRGSTATVKWKFKFREGREYWWVDYVAVIKVK